MLLAKASKDLPLEEEMEQQVCHQATPFYGGSKGIYSLLKNQYRSSTLMQASLQKESALLKISSPQALGEQ